MATGGVATRSSKPFSAAPRPEPMHGAFSRQSPGNVASLRGRFSPRDRKRVKRARGGAGRTRLTLQLLAQMEDRVTSALSGPKLLLQVFNEERHDLGG